LRFLFQVRPARESAEGESARDATLGHGAARQRRGGPARRLVAAAALLLLPALQGCLVHTYQVKQPQMPSMIQSSTADQLVAAVNKQSASIQSLKATVTIQVSVGGARKGKVTDYTSLSGYILLRGPEMLRVLGMLPVVHTPAFDLASDGQNFTLTIPPKDKAYIGTNAVTKRSTNPLENLRPKIFFDTMVLQKIDPDDLVYLTTDTKTYVDPDTHKLLADPEYALTVVRHMANSQELIPERRIHFDRTTLLPSGVDIYDPSGAIQTQAVFGPYASFSDQRYPSTITIRRPIDEYQIVLSFQKLSVNVPFPDNQFQLKVPSGYTVEQLK
jgi:hypothetical protein